jgi:capsule polysaccharide export protein KpsE/RkpR
MAKRSTIGENPLDAVMQENPLDTVVPDLSVAARAGRGQPAPELPPQAQARFQDLEADLKALRLEASGIKVAAAEAASAKAGVAGLQGELTRLRHEVDQLKAGAAPLNALQAEVDQLKEELARIRAAVSGPGDLPWWMRGKKK